MRPQAHSKPWRNLLLAALLAIGALAIAPIPVNATPPNSNGFDNFDSYISGTLPGNPSGSGTFYDFTQTSAGCQTSSLFASSGTNSVQMRKAATVACGGFTFKQSVCTAPLVISFKFYLQALTVGQNGIGVPRGFGGPVDASGWDLRFSTNGNIQLETIDDGAPSLTHTSAAIEGVSAVAGTWYNVTMGGFKCDGTGSAYATVNGKGTSIVNPTITSGQRPNYYYFAAGKGASQTSSDGMFIDDLRVSGAPEAVGSTAVYTQASGNIVGFHTDPMRRAVIIRSTDGVGGSPQAIRTLDSDTLTVKGASPIANSCAAGQLDGVMAYSRNEPGIGYVAYLNCVASSTVTDRFSVRSVYLGTPEFTGTLCTNSNFCDGEDTDYDYQTQDGGLDCGTQTRTLPEHALQITSVESIPIGYVNGKEGSSFARDQNQVMLGFGFTDTAGNVGVWAINLLENEDDESCGKLLPFASSGSNIKQMCTWRNPADRVDYMAAVNSAGVGKVWRVDVTRRAGTFEYPEQPDVSLTQMASFQSAALPSGVSVSLANAIGVACLNNDILVQTSNAVTRVRVLGNGLGQANWTVAAAGFAAGRGVTVSKDGIWVAYVASSTTINVANADTGVVNATVAVPSGGWVGMRLSDTGQNLFVATSSQVVRYDLTSVLKTCPEGSRNCFTNNSYCIGNGDVPTECSNLNPPPASEPSDSSPIVDKETFSVQMGVTTEAGGWILGLLLVACIAAVFWAIRPSLAPIGALVGIGIGKGFDFFPTWFILVLVLGAATWLVLGFATARSRGA